MNLNPSLRSQAHCQFAPVTATTKTCQRAYLPQRKQSPVSNNGSYCMPSLVAVSTQIILNLATQPIED